MIGTNNVSLQFGGRTLFSGADLQFTRGNCYGIIGANGAGKSTFLKILSGELEPTKGEVFKTPTERLSVLKQDHYAYNDCTALRTVLLGNPELGAPGCSILLYFLIGRNNRFLRYYVHHTVISAAGAPGC